MTIGPHEHTAYGMTSHECRAAVPLDTRYRMRRHPSRIHLAQVEIWIAFLSLVLKPFRSPPAKLRFASAPVRDPIHQPRQPRRIPATGTPPSDGVIPEGRLPKFDFRSRDGRSRKTRQRYNERKLSLQVLHQPVIRGYEIAAFPFGEGNVQAVVHADAGLSGKPATPT